MLLEKSKLKVSSNLKTYYDLNGSIYPTVQYSDTSTSIKYLKLYRVLQQQFVCFEEKVIQLTKNKTKKHRNEASNSLFLFFTFTKILIKQCTNIKSDCSASLYHTFICRDFTKEKS